MLSQIGISCFVFSYAIALGLEVSRLFFRSGIRGAVMIGFGGAGLFAHTVFFYYQAFKPSGYPLSNERDWYLMVAWVLAAMYLYLTAYQSKNAFGVFILPLVLVLIGAGMLGDDTTVARERGLQVWGMIHGTSILLETVAVSIGFAAGLMYLEQAHRLKRKLPPRRGLNLPSLEWLQRTNGRAIGVAILTLAIGILSGMVLNVIYFDRPANRVPLNDPVVLSTLAMFVWLVVSGGISVFYRPAREGRKVAYLTVLSFIFLAIALSVGLFFETRHWQSPPQAETVVWCSHASRGREGVA